MEEQKMKLGFIGAGNMAGAIFKGLIKAKAVEAKDIFIIRNNPDLQKQQENELGVTGCGSYEELIENCDVVFLGVKPVVFPVLLDNIKNLLERKKPLIVSMAAGITLDSIEEMLGFKPSIVRIMPNINAEILMSATAYCGNDRASSEQLALVKKYMSAIGLAVELPEKQFAVFTAIAGCSPAYVYMFIDALARGAQKLGMNKQQALDISAQAVIGSASMYAKSGKHPAELVDKVCSPGGTTIEGVCTLDEYKFTAGIVKAVENSVLKDELLNKK